MKRIVVRSGVYYDSVKLLLLSKELGERGGVDRAMVAMATPTNLEILTRQGWSRDEVGQVSESDLFVAVEAADPEALEAALEWAQARLTERTSARGEGYRPKTLRSAMRDAPASNLVQISVPGAYAYREARRALLGDRHVMLFSDNVPVEEEVALKDLAVGRGLLMMGPDCGTAVLNGACLGFSNVVPTGPVGIVAASGTGAQEVSVLLARAGIGVSQVIGTGGRDLSAAVGGRMMRMGLAALEADPDTRVIVLVSKPPAEEVGDRILAEAGRSSKPVIVNFLGRDPTDGVGRNVTMARTLEDAARAAASSLGGEEDAGARAAEREKEIGDRVARERARLAPRQRYVRGLFVGGTLADEAMVLLKGTLGTLFSNGPVAGCSRLEEGARSVGHTILDMGADEFTAGRAHPMIDPTLRNLRIAEEARDPEVAVLLIDVVLGYGSHSDPAGEIAGVIAEGRAKAAGEGRHLVVAASVCGTEGDPQGLEGQENALREAGAHVFASNAEACRFSAALVAGIGDA